MCNIKFNTINEYRDVSTINMYQQVKNKGGDLVGFLEAQKRSARDNGRTPFQWDGTANAGFTTGMPWLTVNPDYTTVNEAAEDKAPHSVLNYFRQMVKLRKENPVLVYGKYTLLDRANPNVYAFTRELDGKKVLVLLNFKSKTATVNTGIDMRNAKVLTGNYSTPSSNGTLQPYEAVIYALQG